MIAAQPYRGRAAGDADIRVLTDELGSSLVRAVSEAAADVPGRLGRGHGRFHQLVRLRAQLPGDALGPARGEDSHCGRSRRDGEMSARTRDEKMTVKKVIADLKVASSTFYRWRQLGKGPRSIKLPNGDVRIRRSEYERWLAEREDAA